MFITFNRCTSILGIYAVTILPFASAANQGPQPSISGEPIRTLSAEVNMGTASLSLSGTCLILNARLSAENFFEGVEVLKTASGRQYRKGPKVLTSFPPILRVRILAWPRRCSPLGLEDPSTSRALLEHLTARADWKTELKLRPADKMSFSCRELSNEEWNKMLDSKRFADMGLPPLEPEAKGIWLLEAIIEDHDVPLTDSLVLTLLSADGKFISRFSARM